MKKITLSEATKEQIDNLVAEIENGGICHQDGTEYNIGREDGKTYIQFYVEFPTRRRLACENIMLVVEQDKVTVSLCGRFGFKNKITDPKYATVPNKEYCHQDNLVQIVKEAVGNIVEEVYQMDI